MHHILEAADSERRHAMTSPPRASDQDVAIVNLDQAKFECIFGRGCDGVCCHNGRPPVYPGESVRITANLHKFLPELRPEAREIVETKGFLSGRRKAGQPMMRVAAGSCVFFNRGCVLHKVGAREGDKLSYKPEVCALFPLWLDRNDRWYVRQKGWDGEIWDLFCLDPASSDKPAAESLRDEIALVRRHVQEALDAKGVETTDQPADITTSGRSARKPIP